MTSTRAPRECAPGHLAFVARVAILAGVLLIAAFPTAASGQLEAVTAATPPCARLEVTYAITGNLRITGTPLGAGDGTHSVGPGALVLRVDTRSGRAQLVAFDLQERFAVTPSAVMWNATVLTDAAARVAPDSSGEAGSGRLLDGVLRWSGPIRGYHTDGALICNGTLCGKFGAPPPGRSDIHTPAVTVRFQPLRFERGSDTFQMAYALVSESMSPPQKTYLAMAGRRTRQACLQEPSR
ncbi:MAG TPA: hypothetical protein VEK07_22890 [Polyangiaceae bacterium]|nr:hypothetical protein [Polyangiaceae bacterium]